MRVQAHRVDIDPPVGLGQRRWLPIGDHDDLPHVLALSHQNASRQLQSFRRVRVIRPHLRVGQLADRNLLGRIVEQHDPQRVAGELRANQVRERERDFFRRCEAVLAVQNHRVRAVEHQYRRGRRAVYRLMHHQIVVLEIDRHAETFALQCVR